MESLFDTLDSRIGVKLVSLWINPLYLFGYKAVSASFTFFVTPFSKMTFASAGEDCRSSAAAQLASVRLNLSGVSPA